MRWHISFADGDTLLGHLEDLPAEGAGQGRLAMMIRALGVGSGMLPELSPFRPAVEMISERGS